MSNKDNSLSNTHEVGGVIYHIGDTENKGKKKDFYVREFVLEIKSNYKGTFYTTFNKFELKGENYVKMVDNYEVGDPVVVKFALDGRKWENPEGEEVFFLSLKAIEISQMPEALQDRKKDIDPDEFQYEMPLSELDKQLDKAIDNDKDDEDDGLPF